MDPFKATAVRAEWAKLVPQMTRLFRDQWACP